MAPGEANAMTEHPHVPPAARDPATDGLHTAWRRALPGGYRWQPPIRLPSAPALTRSTDSSTPATRKPLHQPLAHHD